MQTVRFLLLLLVVVCGKASAEERFGAIDFPNSGKPEAQAAFLRGMVLLHNFAYPQAQRAFAEAESIDPQFVLAYWGEAMTYNHPLWNQGDVEAGHRVVVRAQPLKASASPRERGYLESVECLFFDSWPPSRRWRAGEKQGRDRVYEKAMERLARANPTDVEAQLFWALSILGTGSHEDSNPQKAIRAAAILEELFLSHPDHPGVLHYLIHAYDDPLHAPLGLRAARRYARVASASPHALHMPSHIFVQLGMWDEAARSNEESYALGKEWMAREHADLDPTRLHSLMWLEYIYLQQHRLADARRLLDEVAPQPGESAYMLHTRQNLQYRYASETGEWTAFDFTSLEGRALRAIAEKRFGDAQRAVERLASLEESDHESVSRVELDELRATLAEARGRRDEALRLARSAVQADAGRSSSGPPDAMKPPLELEGELLLKAGRGTEALDRFRSSLLLAPNRAASLRGAALAAASIGDTSAAAEYGAALAAITH